jgi:flagellar basal-body rod protein FlgG
MIRALYTAATGMPAQQLSIDVIANNLANVNTTGFKKSRADFQDLLYQTMKAPGAPSTQNTQSPTGIQVGLGSRPAAVQRVNTQGDYTQTGNEFDVAVEGLGFFQVTMPDGSQAFTRAGAFKLDNQSRLVNSDGMPLEPSISIPDGAIDVSIGQDGVVARPCPGRHRTQVGQLQTAPATAGLRARSGEPPPGEDTSGPPSAPGAENAARSSKFLEGSNVSVAEELVGLITGQRVRSPRRRSRPPTRCCGRRMRRSLRCAPRPRAVFAVVAIAAAGGAHRRRAGVRRGRRERPLGDVAAPEGQRAQLASSGAGARAGRSQPSRAPRARGAAARPRRPDTARYTILAPWCPPRRDVTTELPARWSFLVEQFADGVREARPRACGCRAPRAPPAGAFEARVVVPPGGPSSDARASRWSSCRRAPSRDRLVTADVALEGAVRVARRPIGRRETLQAEDIPSSRASANGGDLVSDPREAGPRRARGAARAGAAPPRAAHRRSWYAAATRSR